MMSFVKVTNALPIMLLLGLINISSTEIVTSSDRIELVLPVLAPPMNSRARVTETAKDYPVLWLLANNNISKKEEVRSGTESQPIYVERLEERINPRHAVI
ncbi:unnamed protein product [Parnassius apollo]|uniref:(apollo) hypothetical protein n=1 Tax=Parnassius apollo TaxID=110799 RepID=A0A8S3WUQ8_PARAO|nr:unnamed protein product [Parnassius apollo]